MSIVTRNRIAITTLLFMVLTGTVAHAASVVWTVDSTATSLGVWATGKAPVSGAQVELRAIIQGSNPLLLATPTLALKMSGKLVTDTDFTSSIKFLKTGTLEGEVTGNWKPDQNGNDNALPGDIGATIQAKVAGVFLSAADTALREMKYDFSAPSAIAISGGTFPTTTASTSIVSGRLDFRGYGVGSVLGSGSTDLVALLPGDGNYDRSVDGGDYTLWADNYLTGGGHSIYNGNYNQDAAGTVDGGDYTVWADNYLQTATPFFSGLSQSAKASISKVGGTYKLSIPTSATIYLPVNEGETSTTTDDIFVYATVVGTLVATAPAAASASAIPEPSTLVLLGVGLIGLTGFVPGKRKSA